MTAVKAQQVIQIGSFVISKNTTADLKSGELYRVEYVHEDGGVELDTNFCGTTNLRNRKLSPKYFMLAYRQEIKDGFKDMTQARGFRLGATFIDFDGITCLINESSRFKLVNDTSIYLEYRVAGGCVWHHDVGWSKATAEAPKTTPAATPAATQVKSNPTPTMGTIEQQIVNVVENHLSSDNARAAMESNVESLLNKWGIDKSVKTIEVKQQDKEPVKVGLVHFKFETILKSVSARVNIALVGAAGSGKTTTAAKVAKALGLDFYSKSVSAQTGAHEFFGYQDANGNYVRTLFRDAYENGGVFLLDEFDAGNPNVLAALNQATANDSCAFADGMIPKHDDFVCIMAGNTYGHGANSEYVGRNKIDAATLDRFAFIDFPYDENLEMALAENKEWCKKVQSIRNIVNTKKIRTIVSPRATIMGSQLLKAGLPEDEVMNLVIYKGLNQDEINLIKF